MKSSFYLAVFTALSVSGLLSQPVWALTKPGDQVQILSDQLEPHPSKRYLKAWKDLKLDAASRQKILQAEKKFEALDSASYRVYAIRLGMHTNGQSFVDTVMFISQFSMAIYRLRSGKHCMLNLDVNGSFVDGEGCGPFQL